MDAYELDKKHDLYTKYEADWTFHRAAFEGTEALVDGDYFTQHERESDENYERRKTLAISFCLSEAIIELFVQYLFAKDAVRDYGRLDADTLFERFLDDADFFETDFDAFLKDSARWASVFGHVGILVDKPAGDAVTRKDELEAGLYPYCSRYFPDAIYDWTFERQASGRFALTYLKLLDEDGKYRIWYADRWEVWRNDEDDPEPVLEATGANPLKEIPFVWLYSSKRPDERGVGVSDIREIARIDVSLMENLSQGEEIINYAAFPMMRMPFLRAGAEDEEEVSPTAILEFDPDLPDSRPDWLEAKVRDPLDAIADWMDRKIQHTYRSAHASSVAGVEDQAAKSGIALKREFMELGAKLSKKSRLLEHAERSIVRFWGRWQSIENAEASIEYPREFDIEDLEADLQNMLTGKALVISQTFHRALSKRAARRILPGLDQQTQDVIDGEIEAADMLAVGEEKEE